MFCPQTYIDMALWFGLVLRLIYIGDVFTAILSVIATRDSHYLLALATLGEATEMEMILIAKVK